MCILASNHLLTFAKLGLSATDSRHGGPLDPFHAGPHLLRRGILSLTPDGQCAFEYLQTFQECVVAGRSCVDVCGALPLDLRCVRTGQPRDEPD